MPQLTALTQPYAPFVNCLLGAERCVLECSVSFLLFPYDYNAERLRSMSSGQVRFQYLRDLGLYKNEKPFILEDTTSYDKGVVTNVVKDYQPVRLTDIRGHEDEYDFKSHSFRFIKHKTAIDFFNTPKQDSLAYIKETMTILQQQFGPERTICYDVRVCIFTSAQSFLLLITSKRRSSTEERKHVEFAKGIPENTFQEPRQPAPPVYAVHIGM
ncbi:MAG: hypothetical protein Q9226_003488 [Calogaya cf. arnoldii]